MTRQDAATLIDYHYWARDRMLEALDALTPEDYAKDLGSSFKSVRDTVGAHLWSGMDWYERGSAVRQPCRRMSPRFRPRDAAPGMETTSVTCACWSTRWLRPTSSIAR